MLDRSRLRGAGQRWIDVRDVLERVIHNDFAKLPVGTEIYKLVVD